MSGGRFLFSDSGKIAGMKFFPPMLRCSRSQIKPILLLPGLLLFAGCSGKSGETNEAVSSTPANQPSTPRPTKATVRPTTRKEGKAGLTKKQEVSYDHKLARRYSIIKVEDSSLKAITKPLSSYSIDEVKSLPMSIRKTYRIVVPVNIKENQVKPTIDKIISKITARNGDIDEITLFLYSDKKIADSVYDVARATWAPNGEWGSTTPEIASSNDRSSYKTVIDVKPDLETYLKGRDESKEKFGLSDEKRKQIYIDLDSADAKAQVEADAKYPTDDTNAPDWQDMVGKNNQFRDDLRDEIWRRVAKENHLSIKQRDDIYHEGFTKNWPSN
jgi:hypothetical protein